LELFADPAWLVEKTGGNSLKAKETGTILGFVGEPLHQLVKFLLPLAEDLLLTLAQELESLLIALVSDASIPTQRFNFVCEGGQLLSVLGRGNGDILHQAVNVLPLIAARSRAGVLGSALLFAGNQLFNFKFASSRLIKATGFNAGDDDGALESFPEVFNEPFDIVGEAGEEVFGVNGLDGDADVGADLF